MIAWLAVPLALALVLVAAKAHGRQLRLEREAFGVTKVDFRGGNDPRVEAMWARDRRGFWTLFAALAAISAALLSMLRFFDAGLGFAAAWAAAFLVVDLALCFTAMGLWSWARMGQQPDLATATQPAWQAAAHRGSRGWWALTLALLVALLASLA